MSDFDTTVRALRRWIAHHDLQVSAAVELLIEHETWIRRADFRARLHREEQPRGLDQLAESPRVRRLRLQWPPRRRWPCWTWPWR